ncbi:integrase catalytic domain-containing protein [Trichonephila clavipes]|nr:integrase catalytic domain-containing protein [Trichonephila clavipes]
MKNNSFFPLETTTEVNQDEPQFALSVNAESFVPKVGKTQIVATACFKNKCLLSTTLILVKDKYSEWQTFRALFDDRLGVASKGTDGLRDLVQNRVAKIQELYPNQLWRHVPSDQNPADLVSRGVDPDKLLQQNLWFNGPTFLSAVHFELVSDLTSQAFIAVLKRFMARRGKCAKLFSDNGKNFVGASNEIKKLLEIVRNPDEKLTNYLAAEGIEWKVIPARSPNFGGLWEVAIKSCKYHLKRVVNGNNLTYE